MLRHRLRCREVTGPTPHSVAVRAKLPLSRPSEHVILQRQKQEAERDQAVQLSRSQQKRDAQISWLQSSERHLLRGAVHRQVQDAVRQHESSIQERRDRLRVLLEEEEQQLLQELEVAKETTVDRQARMREKAQTLRLKRESERQQLVSDKLEQLFRDQCEELRIMHSRSRVQQVSVERAAQVRNRQEQQLLRQHEEKVFEELWEADRRAKDERQRTKEQRWKQGNAEQLNSLRSQMEVTEQQKQREKELREEEVHLRLQQQELHVMLQQRQRQQKLQDQRSRRQELDLSLRRKMKRLAREEQEELERDMSLLQQLQAQESNERQEAAQRKLELGEEQRRYQQYLYEELQKKRREEEEMELVIEEKLKETWIKREEQSRLQREARSRLMSEVMEERRLQLQHKLELNAQRQAEVLRGKEELNRFLEEMRLTNEEDRRRRWQTCEAYRADLTAQVRHQQWLRSEEQAQAKREHRQGLLLQQLYEQKKEKVLSIPISHFAASHPFRRAEGSSSAPQHRLGLAEST